MRVLGIETSCDETAAAVVDGAAPLHQRILSNVVHSQVAEHTPYGGVVPEVAARAHLELIEPVVARAMAEAGLGFADLDGVAATFGPGLIGGVMVGATVAKAIALAHKLPLAAVNHLEGHALTARLTDDAPFPYLLLLVSGGHCQLLMADGVGRYRRLGTTIDDAAGEAFDKTAKLLGLGFPGGPAIERAAQTGDAARFALPRPLRGRPGCDFSFSGLKTAVRIEAERLGRLSPQDVADLAAAVETAIADCLADRTRHALAMADPGAPRVAHLVVAGGVAANQRVRRALAALARHHDVGFLAPPPRLCTDNAAMIAWAGAERLAAGLCDPLTAAPRPRWPLQEIAPTAS